MYVFVSFFYVQPKIPDFESAKCLYKKIILVYSLVILCERKHVCDNKLFFPTEICAQSYDLSISFKSNNLSPNPI